MAKVFLTDINLNQNELKNAVIHLYNGNPNSPAVPGSIGQIIYDSQGKLLYQHNGSQWVTIGNSLIDNITVGGNNVTITNKTAIIPTADSTHEGTLTASDYNTFMGKQDALASQTAYTQKGTSTKVPQITTNTLGQVTGITEVNIDFPSGSGSVTGDSTTFVKTVSLSGHTLSGTTQSADSTITGSSTSLPTTAAVYDFVNSSIENVAAYYITKNAAGDSFDSEYELENTSPYYSGGSVRVPTRNDYAIVLHDETHASDIGTFETANEYIGYYVNDNNTYILITTNNVSTYVTAGTTHAYELPTCRYINSSSTTTPQWDFQYVVNNSGLTSAQVAALNSGINATKVSNYDSHLANSTIHVTSSDKTNWNSKLDSDGVKALLVSAGSSFTIQTTNGALTPSNGIATWTILASGLTSPITGTSFDLTKAIITVFETSTKNEVMTDITYGDSSNNRIIIKMNSTSNIAAGTYTCTINAPLKNN